MGFIANRLAVAGHLSGPAQQAGIAVGLSAALASNPHLDDAVWETLFARGKATAATVSALVSHPLSAQRLELLVECERRASVLATAAEGANAGRWPQELVATVMKSPKLSPRLARAIANSQLGQCGSELATEIVMACGGEPLLKHFVTHPEFDDTFVAHGLAHSGGSGFGDSADMLVGQLFFDRPNLVNLAGTQLLPTRVAGIVGSLPDLTDADIALAIAGVHSDGTVSAELSELSLAAGAGWLRVWTRLVRNLWVGDEVAHALETAFNSAQGREWFGASVRQNSSSMVAPSGPSLESAFTDRRTYARPTPEPVALISDSMLLRHLVSRACPRNYVGNTALMLGLLTNPNLRADMVEAVLGSPTLLNTVIGGPGRSWDVMSALKTRFPDACILLGFDTAGPAHGWPPSNRQDRVFDPDQPLPQEYNHAGDSYWHSVGVWLSEQLASSTDELAAWSTLWVVADQGIATTFSELASFASMLAT